MTLHKSFYPDLVFK